MAVKPRKAKAKVRRPGSGLSKATKAKAKTHTKKSAPKSKAGAVVSKALRKHNVPVPLRALGHKNTTIIDDKGNAWVNTGKMKVKVMGSRKVKDAQALSKAREKAKGQGRPKAKPTKISKAQKARLRSLAKSSNNRVGRGKGTL